VYDRETLLTTLLDVVKADVVNAIHCELQILAFIQHKLIGAFPSTTLKHCKSLVTDIPDQKEQKKIVSLKHNRSHRAAQENVKSILRDYFFPKMLRLATEVTLKCKVCSTAKYTRHPTRLTVGQTPISCYSGEILHIDIFSTDGKLFLTCFDKFSKYFKYCTADRIKSYRGYKIPNFEYCKFFS